MTLVSSIACDRKTEPIPDLYLWTWQRSDDLAFIDPTKTGLAIWIATISLGTQALTVDARATPVRYPTGTHVIAVLRLEAEPSFSHDLAAPLAERIVALVGPVGAHEVQIDFDATRPQRVFYAQLLAGLRARLPGQRLSITALASWCLGDPWIENLPIDAAVPMYYRMGLDHDRIRHYLAEGRPVSATICRDNAGYSLDEPDVAWRPAKRVFVFNAERWDETAFEITERKLATDALR